MADTREMQVTVKAHNRESRVAAGGPSKDKVGWGHKCTFPDGRDEWVWIIGEPPIPKGATVKLRIEKNVSGDKTYYNVHRRPLGNLPFPAAPAAAAPPEQTGIKSTSSSIGILKEAVDLAHLQARACALDHPAGTDDPPMDEARAHMYSTVFGSVFIASTGDRSALAKGVCRELAEQVAFRLAGDAKTETRREQTDDHQDGFGSDNMDMPAGSGPDAGELPPDDEIPF